MKLFKMKILRYQIETTAYFIKVGCKIIPRKYLFSLLEGRPNNEIKKYMKSIKLYVYRNSENKLVIRRYFQYSENMEEVISDYQLKQLYKLI